MGTSTGHISKNVGKLRSMYLSGKARGITLLQALESVHGKEWETAIHCEAPVQAAILFVELLSDIAEGDLGYVKERYGLNPNLSEAGPILLRKLSEEVMNACKKESLSVIWSEQAKDAASKAFLKGCFSDINDYFQSLLPEIKGILNSKIASSQHTELLVELFYTYSLNTVLFFIERDISLFTGTQSLPALDEKKKIKHEITDEIQKVKNQVLNSIKGSENFNAKFPSPREVRSIHENFKNKLLKALNA